MIVLNAIETAFEAAGLAVLVLSGSVALFKWVKSTLPAFWRQIPDVRQNLRHEFGHQIVFALEFFISADIIKSIQAPTFAELAKLGLVVIIRMVLHYSLR